MSDLCTIVMSKLTAEVSGGSVVRIGSRWMTAWIGGGMVRREEEWKSVETKQNTRVWMRDTTGIVKLQGVEVLKQDRWISTYKCR